MTDPVLVSLIGFAQAVTVAFVGILAVRLGRVRRDTTATREHVVNDHSTNFRDENDTRHRETLSLFREVRRDIGGLRGDMRGLRDDHRALSTRVDHIKQKGK